MADNLFPLTVSVAVLTYNRLAYLRRTLESLDGTPGPWTLDIVDNGSGDGTAEYVRERGGYCNADGNHTVGHGMNLAIGLALARKPDIVLFSADDYEYRPGWLERLVAFWRAAPPDIAIASLNLEPAYSWNAVTGLVEYGGVRGITRTSLGGSQWSLRSADWSRIGPIREATGGEDLEICRRLIGQGYRLAALDLSVHAGERESAWGNQSWTYARPLPESVTEWMGGSQ